MPLSNRQTRCIVALYMKPFTLLLAMTLCAICTSATAQETPQLPGTPDPSIVPVKDDVLKTDEDSILQLILQTKAKDNPQAIDDVQVAVYDLPSGNLVAKGVTDQYGFLTVNLPFQGAYRIETCNPKYLSTGATINDCGSDGEPTLMCVKGFSLFTYDDALDSKVSDHILKAEFLLSPLEVGNIIDLDNIFYDFDKSTLRPESKRELDQLVRALAMLPGLDIQLRSHTDSRGTESYNKDLSQRRAQSVVDYLIDNGIAASRFTAKGFGESQLVNECSDGVECSEEKHQNNRRTEFEITSYEPQPCEELPEIMASSN